MCHETMFATGFTVRGSRRADQRMGNRAKVKPRGQLEFRRQLGNSSHEPGFDSTGQTVRILKDLRRQAVADRFKCWRKLCLEQSDTWTRIKETSGQAWRKVADMKKLLRLGIASSALMTLLPVVAVAQNAPPPAPA